MIYRHVTLEVYVRPCLFMESVKRNICVKHSLLAFCLNISLTGKYCGCYDHGEMPILCYSQGHGGYRRERNREQCRTADLHGNTF